MSASSKRAGWLATLALLAALLAGGALGYALGQRPRPQRLKQVALLGVTRAELLDSLQLDAEQRSRVDSILDAAEDQAERAITRMMGDVEQLTLDARDRVRAGLSQAQRVRFDSVMARAIPARPRSPLPPQDTAR